MEAGGVLHLKVVSAKLFRDTEVFGYADSSLLIPSTLERWILLSKLNIADRNTKHKFQKAEARPLYGTK